MLLFFDTETTGLPKNWKAPVSDVTNWPRMVQLAWLQYDDDANLVASGNHIIKPEGFTIPPEVVKIHRISTERALQEGEPLLTVLQRFGQLIEAADYLVAHNISFDEKILGAEFIRTGLATKLFEKKKICTMNSTVNYCAIPGPYGNKWPKLSELHRKLFGHDFDEAHDASVDINATAKCFWELRKRKVL